MAGHTEGVTLSGKEDWKGTALWKAKAPTKQSALFDVEHLSGYKTEYLKRQRYSVLLLFARCNMNRIIFILECIGTVAFALSGAMVGLEQRMDLFGVGIMGLIAACGGGVVRDLFLGRLPPVMFTNPVYAFLSVAVSVIVFLPVIDRLLKRNAQIFDKLQLIADAVGLGVFTAVGVSAAIRAGYADNTFFCVFLGTLTGIGGGVLRDVLAGHPPYIFVKDIYACVSIAGALLCALLWETMGEYPAVFLCCAAVTVIRLLAAHFGWSLPKAAERSNLP